MSRRSVAILLSCFIAGASIAASVVPPATAASGDESKAKDEKPALPDILIKAVSTDPTYGYTEKNPIKVGGGFDGPNRERAYLQLLRGPNGETIRFERQGSCCSFETPNGLLGGGLLDVYSVWIGKEKEPKELYINMYDYETPKAPKGFTFASLTVD